MDTKYCIYVRMTGQTKIFGTKKTTFAEDANRTTSQPLPIEEMAGNVDRFNPHTPQDGK